MTPEALSAALQTLGWTHAQFARKLGKEVSVIRRMLGNKEPARPIPGKLAEWIGGLAQYHVEHPLPDDWDSS
jgi:ribosome-binding protein aMBF1 (putative translation factor)